MGIVIDWFAASFTTFIGLACISSLNKKLRSQRGALNSKLNLADISILAITSLLLCLPAWPLLIKWSLNGVVYIYGLLLWIDALLFVKYRIEINRHTLHWFMTGSKGLMKGAPELFAPLKKFSPAALLPVLLLLALWSGSQSMATQVTTDSGLLIYTLVALLRPSSRLVSSLAIVAVALLMGITLVQFIAIKPITLEWQPATLFVLTLTGFAVMYVYKYLYTPRLAFFSTPSLLPNIVKSDTFSCTPDQSMYRDEMLRIKSRLQANVKSGFNGVCKGSNVILITVESLGPYIAPYANPLAKSRLAERFNQNSWRSKQHFSLCPNTTVATNQLYTGQYSNNPYNKSESAYFGAEPRHVKTLQSLGYKALFVDSADIQLYDYHKLLHRIGFDKVWGTSDMPTGQYKADYRLWNMVDTLVDEISDGPFFMHIINDQTHMPYEIIDKKRFNRHKGNSHRAKYLNAFEEVDYVLDEFLSRLEQKVDLSDTILIFTGDHGESFGEFGYSFHSNSVVAEQIQVPFFMRHKALTNREIEHSCHFDLFPTLFDLLGINPAYQYFGQTLGHEHKDKAYFFHSATLKGNTPANFCSLIDDSILWNDRLFSQSYELNWENGKWLRNPRSNDAQIAALNSSLLRSFTLMS